MKVSVLRTVTVDIDGRTVRPSSGPARSLLASLAWRPNEFVADEVAIEQIWGDRLPQNPRDSLYTCANRLRTTLRQAGAEAAKRIRRNRGGYVLDVEHDSVDLHRFRHLARRGHMASREGDARSAVAFFDQGLRMWGQEPLPDVESDWAARVRVGLCQEKTACRVARVEAALRLGRHLEEVSELQCLAEEYPLNEKIAGLLMTALTRNGRLHDALTRYDAVRRALRAEIGDEPGPDLRRLHERVLRREETLPVEPAPFALSIPLR